MTGQRDLLKRAIELRKQQAKKPAAVTPPPVAEKKKPKKAPKVVEASESKKAPEPTVEDQERTPQQQLLDRAIEAKKEAREPVPAPAPVVEEPVVEEPVVKKPAAKKQRPLDKTPAPETVAEVDVKFVGGLNPNTRAFAPTVRKLLQKSFRIVSVNSTRALVKNPLGSSARADVEALVREELGGLGIPVVEVEALPRGDVNTDVSFRIHFTK